MTVLTTTRLLMSKPDDAELVSVALLNGNWDKVDNNFIPAAAMKATANQTLTTSVTTKVAYDSTLYDSYAARSEGAMVSLSNDEITIRKSGLYLCVAAGSFVSNATGVRRLQLVKNGTSLMPFQVPVNTASGSTSLLTAEPMVLAVNDIISANAFQSSGGNLDLSNLGFADGNYLGVFWVGSIT